LMWFFIFDGLQRKTSLAPADRHPAPGLGVWPVRASPGASGPPGRAFLTFRPLGQIMLFYPFAAFPLPGPVPGLRQAPAVGRLRGLQRAIQAQGPILGNSFPPGGAFRFPILGGLGRLAAVPSCKMAGFALYFRKMNTDCL
jgi:hypothetical protein